MDFCRKRSFQNSPANYLLRTHLASSLVENIFQTPQPHSNFTIFLHLQVVLNEFLEQSEEKARESSPPPVRNKAGNGLKCKNRKKKSSNVDATLTNSNTPKPSSSTADSPGASMQIWSDLTEHLTESDNYETKSEEQPALKRKRKPSFLSLNPGDNDLLPDQDQDRDGSSPGASSSSGPSKRPKLDILSAVLQEESGEKR